MPQFPHQGWLRRAQGPTPHPSFHPGVRPLLHLCRHPCVTRSSVLLSHSPRVHLSGRPAATLCPAVPLRPSGRPAPTPDPPVPWGAWAEPAGDPGVAAGTPGGGSSVTKCGVTGSSVNPSPAVHLAGGSRVYGVGETEAQDGGGPSASALPQFPLLVVQEVRCHAARGGLGVPGRVHGGRRQCPCAMPRPCATPRACVTLGACAMPRPRAPHALVPAIFPCTMSITSLCPSCATPCPHATVHPGATPHPGAHQVCATPHPRAVLCSCGRRIPVHAMSSCRAVCSCLPRCRAPRPSHPRARRVPHHVLVARCVLAPIVSLCHAAFLCHAASSCLPCCCAPRPLHPRARRVPRCVLVPIMSWNPSCPHAMPRPRVMPHPGAYCILVPVVSPCHAMSSCHASSCAHRILVPTASWAPWRHVPVPATSRLCVPPAAPAGLGAVPLLGDGSWPPTQDAAGGAAAGLGAAVPNPGLGCWGVPGVPRHRLTPLLPAEALVNSQEWTLARSVPEIRLVGTVSPCPCPVTSRPRPP